MFDIQKIPQDSKAIKVIAPEDFVGLDRTIFEGLDDKAVESVLKHANRFRGGTLSLSVTVCSRDNCVYKQLCPLLRETREPVGKMCPFEAYAVDTWLAEYAGSLKVDLEDKTDRSQIMELVEADILIARTNAILGSEGMLMLNPACVDPDSGQIIYRKEEHVAMIVKERAQKRRDKILKNFIATRDAKLKGTNKLGKELSEYIASLKARKERIDSEEIKEHQNGE